MDSVITSSVFTLAFLLGLRHGIDWDHIAAISDITGIEGEKRKKALNGFLYIFGHAFVIILLGFSAIILGVKLPDWVDTLMGPIVGLTLILLGIWLIISIFIHGKNVRLQSRWGIMFSFLKRTYSFFHHKIAHTHNVPHTHYPDSYGKKAVFGIGMIHGIGAETPTQILLFVTAAGTKDVSTGILLLLTFVSGLVVSNSFISFVTIFGFTKLNQHTYARLVLATTTAIFSIVVGTFFLFGKELFLPVIFGG